jgi:hypothetical protein
VERGLSSYNLPFNDTFSAIYDLRVGKNRRFRTPNAVVDAVAGG